MSIFDAMGTRGFWTSQPDAMSTRGFWSFVAQAIAGVSEDKLIKTVYDLIQGLGKTITYRRGASEFTMKITPPYPCNDRLKSSCLLKHGDCMGYLPNYNLTFTPELNHEVVIDSSTWSVTGIQRVNINGQIGLYGLICEKHGNTNITPSSLWTRLDRRIVPASKKIVDKFGVTVSFDDSGTPYSHRCVVMPRTSDGFYRSTIYRKGDVRVLLPSEDLAFQPKYAMAVTHDSKEWIVERETPFYSGEQVALYELQLRR